MKKFQKLIQAQFEKMCATGQLFRVELTHLFDIYLQAFEGDDIFRDPESSVHNCSLCHNFMWRYGNIVAVDSDAQTQFNILKDIYVTKSSEIEDRKTEREVKAYNQKILALIKEKEDGDLREMSKEQLEKLLK